MEKLEQENPSYHDLDKKQKLQLLYKIKDYTITYRNKLDLPDEFTFGLEIEFLYPAAFWNAREKIETFHKWFREIFPPRKEEWYSHTNIFNYNDWLLSVDDEVDGEFTSPIFHDSVFDYYDIQKVCHLLKEKQAFGGETSSLQINLGGQMFQGSYERLRKALVNYALFEDILYYFSKGKSDHYRSYISTYARPIADLLLYTEQHMPLNEKTWHSFRRDGFYGGETFDKESGLNLSKLYSLSDFGYENVLEVRMPDATYEEIEVQNELNTFGKFFLNSQEAIPYYEKYYRNMMNCVYRLDEDEYYDRCQFQKALEFCDLIFDNQRDKLSFLKQYIKENDYEKVEEKLLEKTL